MENYGIIYTAYFFIYIGELSERFKVRLSKSRVLLKHRGFESHALRLMYRAGVRYYLKNTSYLQFKKRVLFAT